MYPVEDLSVCSADERRRFDPEAISFGVDAGRRLSQHQRSHFDMKMKGVSWHWFIGGFFIVFALLALFCEVTGLSQLARGNFFDSLYLSILGATIHALIAYEGISSL